MGCHSLFFSFPYWLFLAVMDFAADASAAKMRIVKECIYSSICPVKPVSRSAQPGIIVIMIPVIVRNAMADMVRRVHIV